MKKLTKDRPKVFDSSSEVWFYVTPWVEADREKLLTREGYETLRSYEPMLYRDAYEDYVTAYNARQETAYHYTLHSVGVTRDTVDAVYEKITNLPDFAGWLVDS